MKPSINTSMFLGCTINRHIVNLYNESIPITYSGRFSTMIKVKNALFLNSKP